MNAYLYVNVSATASVTIQSSDYDGSGFLHGIIVGDIGTNPVITIYDSSSVSVTTTIISTLKPTITGPYLYDVNFRQGLYVKVTGTPNFTILYL